MEHKHFITLNICFNNNCIKKTYIICIINYINYILLFYILFIGNELFNI